MAIIPLQRRFIDLHGKEELSSPELLSYMLAGGDALKWEDLVAKYRVVVLAEPGSGKSTELKEQARLSREKGRFTFHATVQSVGSKGLERALGNPMAAQLAAWRASDQPAWFFLDSIDEAKSREVPFEEALRELASVIHGAEARAHIILSGRFSEWQSRRDLETLNDLIWLPAADLPAAAPDPNELIISALRGDKRSEASPPAEQATIVMMGALDHDQVKLFAQAKGVTNIDAFVSALGRGNLWDFARRPVDLDWLVGYWREHEELGRLEEMLELCLRQRLQEVDPQRSRRDSLDVDRAMKGVERIGAALVLGRRQDIVVPDSSPTSSAAPSALEVAEILPDWSGEDQARLISRAVFEPPSDDRSVTLDQLLIYDPRTYLRNHSDRMSAGGNES